MKQILIWENAGKNFKVSSAAKHIDMFKRIDLNGNYKYDLVFELEANDITDIIEIKIKLNLTSPEDYYKKYFDVLSVEECIKLGIEIIDNLN